MQGNLLSATVAMGMTGLSIAERVILHNHGQVKRPKQKGGPRVDSQMVALLVNSSRGHPKGHLYVGFTPGFKQAHAWQSCANYLEPLYGGLNFVAFCFDFWLTHGFSTKPLKVNF